MEEHKVKDIYIASVLHCLGYSFLGVEDNDGFKLFIFEYKGNIPAVLNDYWHGVITVNAKDLFSSFKFMKSTLYPKKYN